MRLSGSSKTCPLVSVDFGEMESIKSFRLAFEFSSNNLWYSESKVPCSRSWMSSVCC